LLLGLIANLLPFSHPEQLELTEVGPYQWEFLVVSGDAAVYKALTRAIHALNGVVNYTSNATSAAGQLARRKFDGVFMDVLLEGTLPLMR